MSLADELILEKRYEECRDNIRTALQAMADDERFRRVAVLAYIGLAGIWELDPTEAAKLLSVSDDVYGSWCNGDFNTLSSDELEKISCLLGIYKYLETLYSGKKSRIARWFRQPSIVHPFDGADPHGYLIGASIDKFYLARRYLASRTV